MKGGQKNSFDILPKETYDLLLYLNTWMRGLFWKNYKIVLNPILKLQIRHYLNISLWFYISCNAFTYYRITHGWIWDVLEFSALEVLGMNSALNSLSNKSMSSFS